MLQASVEPTPVQEPLVPEHIAFPGFTFVAFDIADLTEGDISFLSGDGYKAAITLMAKSWVQKPAASLPSEPRKLAALAGFGQTASALAEWEKVSGEALSDFVLCSDGRWYSRTLAVKAVEKWKASRSRTEPARKALAAKRAEAKPSVTATVTESVTDAVTAIVTGSVTDPRRDENREEEMRSPHQGTGVSIDPDAVFKRVRAERGVRVPAAANDQGSPSGQNEAEYAFVRDEMRVTYEMLNEWKHTYPTINVPSELSSIATWDHVKSAGKDWLVPVTRSLAKRERDESQRRAGLKIKAEAEAKLGLLHATKSSRPAI